MQAPLMARPLVTFGHFYSCHACKGMLKRLGCSKHQWHLMHPLKPWRAALTVCAEWMGSLHLQGMLLLGCMRFTVERRRLSSLLARKVAGRRSHLPQPGLQYRLTSLVPPGTARISSRSGCCPGGTCTK